MKFLIFFVLAVSFWLGNGRSDAQDIIDFGPHDTKIIGSIPYSVIGQYQAQFGIFFGRITLAERPQRIRSVYLDIDAKSIQSNCPWCDRIARSRKLLNTARFPNIIFKSDTIIQEGDGYKVKGFLEMHGIKRRMTLPFNAKIIIDQKTNRKYLDLKGNWSIDRKDFNIIWNRYLDRGGIVVGDHFTVRWGIRVYLNGTMNGTEGR